MEYWTWGEAREKIEEKHDLVEEPDFLSEGELIGYFNDAIDSCEQHFIKLPDYFLASSSITLTAGTRDYDLPSDIYATKIRNIWHDQEDYRVKHLKELKHAALHAENQGAEMKFLIINNAGAKPKLRLIPTPDTSGHTLTVDYIRNATRLTEDGGDDQEIDVPEAMGYIFAFVDRCIYEKEKNTFMIQKAEDMITKMETQLTDALATRIDDEDYNQIDPDIDLYLDHT